MSSKLALKTILELNSDEVNGCASGDVAVGDSALEGSDVGRVVDNGVCLGVLVDLDVFELLEVRIFEFLDFLSGDTGFTTKEQTRHLLQKAALSQSLTLQDSLVSGGHWGALYFAVLTLIIARRDIVGRVWQISFEALEGEELLAAV